MTQTWKSKGVIIDTQIIGWTTATACET